MPCRDYESSSINVKTDIKFRIESRNGKYGDIIYIVLATLPEGCMTKEQAGALKQRLTQLLRDI